MLKRVASLGLIASILWISMGTIFSEISRGSLPDGLFGLSQWADRAVWNRLADQKALEQIAPTLLLRAGAKERDGIFITESYLLENIAPSDPTIATANTLGMEQFLARHNLPATLMLIPTACAIKQQEIPANASLYNQKALISETYTRLAGLVTTVDAYSALFSAKDQYTFYRTESNLTGLGGYYLYGALAARIGLTARPLDQFEVEHLPTDYYGDLYRRSNYKGIRPDLLTLYRFSRYDRDYLLQHTENGETKQYYTLFPTHLEEMGDPSSVLFGGVGQRLDISVVSPFEESMLIFGDDTALSYLPFLAVHYGQITLIDPMQATDAQLQALDLEEYNRVMLAFSVDTYLNAPIGARLQVMG